jgi:hypothetical protein
MHGGSMEYDRDWKHSMARLTKDDILDLFAEKMRKIDELQLALGAKTSVASETEPPKPASAVVAVVRRSLPSEESCLDLLERLTAVFCAVDWRRERDRATEVIREWYAKQ